MRRRRKFDIYLAVGIFILTVCYFIYNYHYSESKGVTYYSEALKPYKDGDFTTAYNEFAKIPYASSLKQPALFRQARCATNLGQKELAIKKYKKIVNSKSKSSIVPISSYYMASLMYETEKNSGVYEEAGNIRWPGNREYQPNMSSCENGSTLVWDDIHKAVTVTGRVTDHCTLYFGAVIDVQVEIYTKIEFFDIW